MAMNKKEKQLLEDLQDKLRLAKALRWTEEVLPDVSPPALEDNFGALSTGFSMNSYSQRVVEACSSSCSHGLDRTDRTNSQGSRHLFSSKLLAFKAMRWEIELKCAKELSQIDKLIEQEEINEY